MEIETVAILSQQHHRWKTVEKAKYTLITNKIAFKPMDKMIEKYSRLFSRSKAYIISWVLSLEKRRHICSRRSIARQQRWYL